MVSLPFTHDYCKVICLLFHIIADKKSYEEHNGVSFERINPLLCPRLSIGLFASVVGVSLWHGVWLLNLEDDTGAGIRKETWAFISTIIYAFVLHES